MAYDFGYNFRATSGYVTDDAGYTYNIGETYPTSKTAGGVTTNVGWDVTPQTRDRDNTVGPRLAGLNSLNTGGPSTYTFRVDLPASGTWNVYIACADASFSNEAFFDVLDSNGSTVLYAQADITIASGSVLDAAGTLHTSYALWAANQAPRSLTFSGTAFFIQLKQAGLGAGASILSSLRFTQATVATNTSDADQFILGALGRQQWLNPLVKQQPGDAMPVVFKDFLFDAPAGATQYTLTAAAGAYALAGVAAAIQRSRVLAAAAGSYTLTGVAALVKRSRLLTAAAGSYTMTGNNALVQRGRVIQAATGSYTLAGQAATIVYTPLIGGYTLVANAGAYVLSGQPATIKRSRLLTAAAGSYTLTGQPATILRNKVLPAAAGAYALTGVAATILKSRVLPAAAGAYALTGQAALIKRSRLLTAAAGSYTMTGKAASIVYTPSATQYTLVASPGSYTLNGMPANIVYTGSTPADGALEILRRRRRMARAYM